MTGFFSIALLVFAVPGVIFTYLGIKHFFTNHPEAHMQAKAGGIAFWSVLLMIAIIATPHLFYGLPLWARVVEYVPYFVFLIVGGKHFRTWIKGAKKAEDEHKA